MRKTLSLRHLLRICQPALCALLTTAVFAQAPVDPAAPIAATPPVVKQELPEAPSHKFFDRENVSLLSITTAMQTADLVSTRMVIDRGGREQDPLAKPFVNNGLGPQIVASYAIGTGGTLLGAYWLHRTGHHHLERWVPITVSVVEALAAASNFHVLAGGHIAATPVTRPALLPRAAGSR